MVRVLSDKDVASVMDLESLLSVIEEAFEKQGQNTIERPERPHFPVGVGLDPDATNEPLGTGLVMPAYLHAADHYAIKLVSVHERNADRGLSTVNAQIALTEAATGRPAAYIAGARVTNARTGCIGGLAARELTVSDDSLVVGVFGAGQQARWQVRAIDAAVGIETIRLYSPNSREECAADLREENFDATAVGSPTETVAGADMVVTATTSTEPVFDGTDLDDGTLVVAIGAYTAETRELDDATFDRTARIYADVPEEVAEIGDVRERYDAADFIPFSDVFAGHGRNSPDEIIVVESVGTAVLDAAAAEYIYDAAVKAGIGETVTL